MNEFDFIRLIREQTQRRERSPDLSSGVGDDAAVFTTHPGRENVLSVDLLIEDIDFRRNSTPPRLLGHKALAVSLSDIAAMGAQPRWVLLSVGVPEDVWNEEFVTHLYEGLFQLADRYGVKLIGGDTSRTPEKIVVDSIVLGECNKGQAITRSGAQAGDEIFVTGSFGGAAAGLRLLDRGAQLQSKSADAQEANAIEAVLLRQLRPEPRVGWGLVLGEEQLASSMIDVSDGLSSDLHHLCEESDVGALIDAGQIPFDPSLAVLCGRRALDPLMLALHGGEDFELLFTVRAANVSKLPKKVDGVPITRIGKVEPASSGVRIAEGARVWDLAAEGFQHFETKKRSMKV
jgi:thiamine-monophosphate kinase